MGLYTKYILPRLVDLSMRNKETSRLRAEWLPHAGGDVLEVGIGSGLNLPFYSSEVQRVYGVDPSLELQRMALTRATATRARVEFLSQSTEDTLPLADGTIDTVVMTWTLCSMEPTNSWLSAHACRECKDGAHGVPHSQFLASPSA